MNTILEKFGQVAKYHKYVVYMAAVLNGHLVPFPRGYVCDACKIAFSNFQARNFHAWKEHPGCAKYRKRTFWDYLFDSEETNGKMHGCYHSCRCSKISETPCFECDKNKGPFR